MPAATVPVLDRPTTGFRISFSPAAAPGAEIVAQFQDPRPMVATQELFNSPGNIKLCADQFEIICIHQAKGKTQTLWEPGRAIIQASSADSELLLPAIIEFGFYEGELQKLEAAIFPYEATADADVALAYSMQWKNRPQWNRLYESMEQLYRLRLQFARLEPHLHRASRLLPIEGRHTFAKLVSKAQVADRLEALSNRLEACEDLYEGAVDRISDFKMYRKGNLLEVAIVILLALEVVLLLTQGHHL